MPRFTRIGSAAALAALGLAAHADAQLVELTWTGLVTETERLDLAPASLQGVTTSDIFTISMILDKQEVEAGNPSGIYAGPFKSVTITIGAASASSIDVSLLTVDFFSDFLGGLRDEFSVSWDTNETPPYFTDGTALSESWSAQAGLPLGTLTGEIPTSLDVSGDLLIPNTGAVNIGWNAMTSTPQGDVTTAIRGLLFNVRAEIVPAPGAVGAMAMAGLLATFRRRRVR